jgi:hypothetical protein
MSGQTTAASKQINFDEVARAMQYLVSMQQILFSVRPLLLLACAK